MGKQHREFSIRRATSADAQGILDCLAEAFEPFRKFYSAEGYADTTLTPQTIHERLKKMTVYVATDASGEIVGTIACAEVPNQEIPEGHIRGMAVREAHQGRGLAEQLLATAEDDLRQRGCRRISLNTTAPLQRAIRFYEKHGYRASGKVGDHFGMPLYEYVKQ